MKEIYAAIGLMAAALIGAMWISPYLCREVAAMLFGHAQAVETARMVRRDTTRKMRVDFGLVRKP